MITEAEETTTGKYYTEHNIQRIDMYIFFFFINKLQAQLSKVQIYDTVKNVILRLRSNYRQFA